MCDPKHTANVSEIKFGEVSTKSKTEAVWDHLDRERNEGQPKSKELWEVLKDAKYHIPEDY